MRKRECCRTGKVLRWTWGVDFFHACEYVSQLSDSLFGVGTKESQDWFKEQRHTLRHDTKGVQKVVTRAAQQKRRHGLAGSEKDYNSAKGYLIRYRAHMDYAKRRNEGDPIGSGVTEAGCKVIFNQRMKQSGMRWSKKGGKPILSKGSPQPEKSLVHVRLHPLEVPLSTPVFCVACDAGVNLRTALARLIVLAGLTPWQKLFVNLRSSRETELLAVFPVADVCRWFGHSPAVAARFYAQARTEVADRASQERTLSDTLVGTTVGTIQYPVGTKMGTIGANQETSKKRQECIETQQNEGVLKVSEGVGRAADSNEKWTILDSNQRPPRCQRGALTN